MIANSEIWLYGIGKWGACTIYNVYGMMERIHINNMYEKKYTLLFLDK